MKKKYYSHHHHHHGHKPKCFVKKITKTVVTKVKFVPIAKKKHSHVKIEIVPCKKRRYY
ncbi:hypothetical protein PAECIP111890_03501 [Paenibacillus sp. JJ-223]|nr:hypothetical protein PAECIP111890_03501 [Paenibacillus sp. JJ-223]